MAKIDTTPARNAYGYFITLTCALDFNASQEDQIIQWHRRKCENCLLVKEYHKDGTTHYHSTVLVMAPKTTNGLTRQFETLYKRMNIDVVPRVSIIIKSTTDQVGAFYYCLKEHKQRDPLLVLGWQMIWIKEQLLSNVKHIPRKMLMKDRVVLNAGNAIPYCLKFAEASGLALTGKMSFKTLVRLMVKDGYSFDNTKFPWLYAQLMCIMGDDRALDQQIDNQLAFLD